MAGMQKESAVKMIGNCKASKASGSNGNPKAKPGKGKSISKKAVKNQY